jgi:hypothetical protein
MRWRLSRHAREEISRRNLVWESIAETIVNPHQVVPVENDLKAYQSLVRSEEGRRLLLRVIVDDSVDPMVVVTVYRTSKVDKYWRRYEDLL